MLVFGVYGWIMLAAAVAPAAYLMLKIFQLDGIEKEPPRLLGKLCVFGMISAIPAIILEKIGFSLLDSFLSADSILYTVIEAFLCVALVEEGVKLFFLKLGSWRSLDFNYQFDGVVYAVFVGLGFALLENIQYVFSYGLGVALSRGLLAVPLHACAAVYMGINYGEAKAADVRGKSWSRSRNLFEALFIPVILHGFYDMCLFFGNGASTLVFYIFVAVLFLFTLHRVKKASRGDFNIYYENL